MEIGGSGGTTRDSGTRESSTRDAAAERAAAERAAAERAAAAEAARLSVESRQALTSINGQSAFEVTRATSAAQLTGVAPARALDVWDVTAALDEQTARLEAATAAVSRLEEQLAVELTTLAPALPQEELQRYADTFRAAHPEYQRARDAARELVELHERLAPDMAAAVEAAAPSGRNIADTRLEGSLDAAAAALERQISADPRGDPELAEALERAGNSLGTLSNAAATGGGAAQAYASTGRRLAELAGKASSAFGAVGGVFDAMNYGSRIANGTARTEHVIGAGVAVAEVGVGVATIAGVTVGAPVAVALAAVGVGASAVSSYRDAQERAASIQARLESLGYDRELAAGLAGSSPLATGNLRDAGFTTDDLQALARSHPGLLGSSVTTTSALTALRRLELEPARAMGLFSFMHQRGVDAPQLLADAELLHDPEDARGMLAAIRAVDYRGAQIADYLAIDPRSP